MLTFQYYQHSSGGPVQRFHLESASMLLVAFLTAVVLTSPVAAQPEDRTPDRAFYDGSSIGLSSSLAAIFIVTALLLYAKGLGLGLFGDDFVIVSTATAGHYSAWGGEGFIRPMLFVIWSHVVQGFGVRPWLLHSLNVGLHGMNAFLVTRLAARLGLSQRAAWTGGLLFLAFPGVVEAVEWTSDLPDVMMTTAVLAFVLLCTAPQSNRIRFLAAGLAFAVALATKETAVCAPMLAAIVASGQSLHRRQWVLIGVAFCVAGGYALWRLTNGSIARQLCGRTNPVCSEGAGRAFAGNPDRPMEKSRAGQGVFPGYCERARPGSADYSSGRRLVASQL